MAYIFPLRKGKKKEKRILQNEIGNILPRQHMLVMDLNVSADFISNT